MTVRLEGKPVAAAVQELLADRIRRASPPKRPPTLASVHRAEASPFSFYLRQQHKVAEAVGLRLRDEPIPPGTSPSALVERLRALDGDPEVDGVLLEHPLPAPYDFAAAIGTIRPEKDIDGVSAASLGLLAAGRPRNVPAVARAALAIADHYKVALHGERVAVVGRSETVGLPLALMLLARGAGHDATVTVAHSRTPDLGAALAGATVVFGCAGHPGLLTREVVPYRAAVIDVGLSSVPDPSRPSGARAVGDADPDSLEGWARALTPVPGGVGAVTVTELLRGVVEAWERSTSEAKGP